MTMHRLHPIYDAATLFHWNLTEADPPGVLLFDNCPRCDEHAAFPLGLDDQNLQEMWDEMVYAEKAGYYRNETEAKAGRYLYYVALFLERMLGVNPWQPISDIRYDIRILGG